jgi:hypothetical protein
MSRDCGVGCQDIKRAKSYSNLVNIKLKLGGDGERERGEVKREVGGDKVEGGDIKRSVLSWDFPRPGWIVPKRR